MLLKFMYRYSVWKLPLPLQEIFQTHSDIHEHNTRNKLNPIFNAYVGNLTENSFVTRGPRIWKEIPENNKNCDTIKEFTKKSKNWIMNRQ